VQSPAKSILNQQQLEHEQEVVGQEVVPPGVNTTMDEVEQVEPKCLLNLSMVSVSFLQKIISLAKPAFSF